MTDSIDLEPESKPIRRGSCFGAILFLLVIGIIPIFTCRLITLGTVQLGSEDGNFLNIYMLQDPEQEGVGVQWTRSFDEEAVCTRTKVRFFMFAGEGENLDYCSCTFEPDSRPLPNSCVLSE